MADTEHGATVRRWNRSSGVPAAWATAALMGSAWDTATTVSPGWRATSRASAEVIRVCISRNDSPPGKRKPLGLRCTVGPLGLLGQVRQLGAGPLAEVALEEAPVGADPQAQGLGDGPGRLGGALERRGVDGHRAAPLPSPARAPIRSATASAWARPSSDRWRPGARPGRTLPVVGVFPWRTRRTTVGRSECFGSAGHARSPYSVRRPGRPPGAAPDRAHSGPGTRVPWSRSSWDRREGHQFHRPSSTTTDGTSRVRTKNVSSRMPAARPTPISTIWVSPVAVSTPNVPARIRPADVTVVPVASTACRTAT